MLEDVVRREDLRAADVDRQFVADALRDAVNEGRLSLSEYDERLAAAYGARTYGELDRLLNDLPAPRPARHPTAPATSAAGTASAAAGAAGTWSPSVTTTAGRPLGWLAAIWGGWLTASLICTVIWALTGANVALFWPGWVIGIGGIAAFGRTVQAVASGDPERYVRQRSRQRAARRRQRAVRRAHRHC
ncbi:MAG TPA: DUF1707 domain-containing protein [Micromonosporaceae bacterium]